MKKCLYAFLFLSLLTCSVNAQKTYNMRGIKYTFNRETETPSGKTYYACFVGTTKSGWNEKTGKSYPAPTRQVYSMVYRLPNMPATYDGSSPSRAPSRLKELFMEYLVKHYGFNEEIHYAYVLFHHTLKGLEYRVSEDMENNLRLTPREKLVFDEKFTFTYSDESYSVKYPVN